MKTFLLRRMLLMLPTLFGITVITFVVVRLGPNDPVVTAMNQMGMRAGEMSKEVIEEFKKRRGLDRPVHEQYLMWMGRMAKGDFGTSTKDNRPVFDKMAERVPVTLLLSFLSIFLTYALAIPIGIYSVVKQYTSIDKITTLILFILYSLPNFWVAMLLILFLGGGDFLDVFPIRGILSDNHEALSAFGKLADIAWHLTLPVACLTYSGLASISRFQRAAMLEVIRQDYIRTARAKGLDERVVVLKHALRNSLIPIATLLGTLLPALFGGSVIIEKIFTIPGMGLLGFEAVLNTDMDVIMAVTFVSAVTVMLGLLVTDVLYVLIDPRISFTGGKAE